MKQERSSLRNFSSHLGPAKQRCIYAALNTADAALNAVDTALNADSFADAILLSITCVM